MTTETTPAEEAVDFWRERISRFDYLIAETKEKLAKLEREREGALFNFRAWGGQ